MPLKEHYTNDEVNGARQTSYKQYLQELWQLKGEDPASANEITTKVYAFEKCIAEVCLLHVMYSHFKSRVRDHAC